MTEVVAAAEAAAAKVLAADIVCVAGLDDADSKAGVTDGLVVPEGRSACAVATILAKDNKALEEVEEAWLCSHGSSQRNELRCRGRAGLAPPAGILGRAARRRMAGGGLMWRGMGRTGRGRGCGGGAGRRWTTPTSSNLN